MIIFTKVHEDRTNIMDFLLIASKLFFTYSLSFEKKNKNKNVCYYFQCLRRFLMPILTSVSLALSLPLSVSTHFGRRKHRHPFGLSILSLLASFSLLESLSCTRISTWRPSRRPARTRRPTPWSAACSFPSATTPRTGSQF